MEKEKNHIGHFVLAIYNVQICVIIELTVISTIYLKNNKPHIQFPLNGL